MKACTLVLSLLLIVAGQAEAAVKTITYFLDGALVESELSAPKGVAEIHLPGAAQVESLRIKPVGAVEISRVQIVPVRPDQKAEKELKLLNERKGILADRLKALEVREDIFRAAAKSQSSKAPRKSKANPEPMDNIRQGTAFAVAQLEEVYRSRRRAESELKSVEERLATLVKGGGAGGRVARVWLNGTGGVKYSYLLDGEHWTPRYDLRLSSNGQVAVALRAEVSPVEKGARILAALAKTADVTSETVRHPLEGNNAIIARYSLAVMSENVASAAQRSVDLSFKNSSDLTLPAGQATCFLHGEFVGTGHFAGAGPGDVREMIFGR